MFRTPEGETEPTGAKVVKNAAAEGDKDTPMLPLLPRLSSLGQSYCAHLKEGREEP